ncbi:MAG: FtsX-like permease family protein, partial [Candidatus Thorarchaeota archaeon]
MAAVPAGYEAFQSGRRRGVTLLCFLLVSTIVMGMTVYVDSYSVHYWEEATDVGDISLIVEGDGVEDILPQVRGIDGIDVAILLEGSEGYLNFEYEGEDIQFYAEVRAPSQEYLEAFPSVFTIITGRMPLNESEIAVTEWMVEDDFLNISIGSRVNYSTSDNGAPTEVTVVGIFRIGASSGDDWYRYYYFYCDLLVMDSLIGDWDYRTTIHADIDRRRISPFDAGGSLRFLTGISEQIYALDPSYSPTNPWSRYYTNDFLQSGVYSYISWQMSTRLSQLLRAAPIILLVVMVSFLAIRFNVNERRYEANMLMARGASEGDVNGIINREIAVIALASCLLGPILGMFGSRVAIASIGFFQFDFALLIQEPFLITIESLILALVIGFLL